MLKHKKPLLVLFLGVQILIITILKYYPEFVEQFYSKGLYIIIAKLMRYSFRWLPFSVGDVFYFLSLIYIIRWLINNRKRIINDTKAWLLDVLSTLSIIYFSFHMLWAYNYYRLPLNKTLDITSEYTTEKLIGFTERLIYASNTIHNQLTTNDTLGVTIPYSKSEIFDKTKNGYEALGKVYPDWNYKPSSIKTSLFSLPLTYMGFSGYINPFTNEAQVDGLIPNYKFPTTSCHEIAHQLGYAAENEANFIGSLAAIANDDLYFKYSGYTFALRYCINEVYMRDPEAYCDLLLLMNTGILKNYKEVQEFWLSYKNPLEPIFESTFDQFLKASNQSGGIESYNYVVALLVNYFDNKPL